jgi:hypothetical protein
MRRVSLSLVIAVVLWGCSATVSPMAVLEARLAARVKTALVNDPEIGTRPIEVHVQGGVVRLVGRVDSAAQADRAKNLASAVEGVAGVVSELQVVAAPVPLPASPSQDEGSRPRSWVDPGDQDETGPNLLALGLSVRRSMPADRALEEVFQVGPLVRLGSGGGFGPAIGFGWYGSDWRSGDGATTLARMHIKPVLGGVAYGIVRQNTTLSLSLVGGLSFNSVDLSDVRPAAEIPLSIDTSVAVRPGVSLWFDMSRRVAINISGSYLVTRPRVRLLREDGTLHSRAVRADAVLLGTGIVYKLF